MAFKFSTGLKNQLLDSLPLLDLLADGIIRVYSGTVPADADAALGSAVLLVTYTDAGAALGAGNGLDMDSPAVSGALSKDPGQTWEGDAVATGTASFFRFVAQDDTGASSTSEVRIQGTVGGAGADMFVQSTSFVDTTTYTIDYFSVAIPNL